MHNTLQLRDLSIHFPNKSCFDDFNQDIYFGDRIAIIGDNGSGKSSLLKRIAELATDATIGFVPQVIVDNDTLSGGQRFNKALSQALALHPDILLLDEPTNHLDRHNRQSLIRLLNNYYGTLIVVTHDVELLNQCIDILWHIQQQQITVFKGNYQDYQNNLLQQEQILLKQKQHIKQQKESAHDKLMQEQQRAAKSKQKGKKSIKQRKWPTIVSDAKTERATKTAGKKKASLHDKQQNLQQQLDELYITKKITPRFSLTTKDITDKTILAISDGAISYNDHVILHNINLLLSGNQHIAIHGDNGSGKSSLFKALMSDPLISKQGSWTLPHYQDIGYLDQHYSTLCPNDTVYHSIETLCPDWSEQQIRLHLSDFLFFTNEEVNNLTANLSGGEKARLCLAQIAANTPKLLLLDEITNNLDLTTRQHVIEILQHYPGAMLLISHDCDFLAQLDIARNYTIDAQTLL